MKSERPKGKEISLVDNKIILIFMVWGISGLGVPIGGFEVL